MVKSDVGVFGIRILAYIVAIMGVITGLILMIGFPLIGSIITILSLVIGRFLFWKSKRREGHIIYEGGRI